MRSSERSKRISSCFCSTVPAFVTLATTVKKCLFRQTDVRVDVIIKQSVFNHYTINQCTMSDNQCKINKQSMAINAQSACNQCANSMQLMQSMCNPYTISMQSIVINKNILRSIRNRYAVQ